MWSLEITHCHYLTVSVGRVSGAALLVLLTQGLSRATVTVVSKTAIIPKSNWHRTCSWAGAQGCWQASVPRGLVHCLLTGCCLKGQLTCDSWIHQDVPVREQKREYWDFYNLILEVTLLLLYLFFKCKLLKEEISQDCDYQEAGLKLPHNYNQLLPA